MAVRRKSGGAMTDMTHFTRKGASLSFIRRREGGVWVETMASIRLSSTHVTGRGSGTALAGNVTSASVTATPTPAASSVSWRRISGQASISPTAPTSTFTQFRGLGIQGTMYAVFVCDAVINGRTVTSEPVTVELTYEQSGILT